MTVMMEKGIHCRRSYHFNSYTFPLLLVFLIPSPPLHSIVLGDADGM